MEEFLQVMGVIGGIVVFCIGIYITKNTYECNGKKSEIMIGGIILSVIAAIATGILIQMVVVLAIVALVILFVGMTYFGWG